MNILMIGTPSTTDVIDNHNSPALTGSVTTFVVVTFGVGTCVFLVAMCYMCGVADKYVSCMKKCSGKKLFI